MPTVEIDTEKLAAWATEHLAPDDSSSEQPPEEDGRHHFNGEGFTITSTHRTPAMAYHFTVEGDVPGGESLEDADTITENDDGTVTVEGTVGPKGSDTYYLEGPISYWEARDDDDQSSVPPAYFDVLVAGEPADLWRVLGQPEPEYDDHSAEALGGGEAYSQKFTGEDADRLVVDDPDAGALRDALANAEHGEVVFVDGDAEIYSPRESERFEVPAGVTLASDRGVDGSEGGLLHTDAAYSYGAQGLVSVRGDDARVTGLRIRGPHPQEEVRWHDHDYAYEMSGVNARRHDAERVEVENCKIWGFAHAVASGVDGWVHHSHLSANMHGLGYCTSTGDTQGTVFEYNFCEHWRHVVAASGEGGYEARRNYCGGPCIGHAFDQHAPGGVYTYLHHNTLAAEEKDISGSDPVFGTFRGENVRDAKVHHNWVMHNDEPPRDPPSKYFTGEWLTMPKNGGNTWAGRVEWWDNHLDESEPDSEDIGCPR